MLEKKSGLIGYFFLALFPLLLSCTLMGDFSGSFFFLCGLLIFLVSLFWGYMGLLLSSSIALCFLLWVEPFCLMRLQSVFFLLICCCSSFLSIVLEEIGKERALHIADLEKQKADLSEKLLLACQELELLEKVNFLKELEESSVEAHLMDLLGETQARFQELEQEIQVLEATILKLSSPVKAPRKKKPKEEKGQGFFPFGI
jgi:hypothetical protein